MQVESYYLENYEHWILYDYADKEDFILMMINEVVSKKLNFITLIKKISTIVNHSHETNLCYKKIHRTFWRSLWNKSDMWKLGMVSNPMDSSFLSLSQVESKLSFHAVRWW